MIYIWKKLITEEGIIKMNNKFNLTREQNVFVAKINVVDWLLKDE